jgi:hypothetical protein
MQLPGSRKRNRLPKKFPIGATYVIEGRGGENGQLRVFSRYVVMPGGERINIGGGERIKIDGARPPRSLARRKRNRTEGRVPATGRNRSSGSKKIAVSAGTNRRGRR